MAIGVGTFLTGSVVFFTHVVHLSPMQIGLGFSLVGLVRLLGSLPLGHLADRLGGKRAWVLGAGVEAICFACFPLARGFWSFLAIMVGCAIADCLASSGRLVYIAAALPTEDRVRSMAFMRAFFNIGFTIGTGFGAVALAFDSNAALIAMVMVNVVGLASNAYFVSRMATVIVARPEKRERTSPWRVLTDRPYLGLSVVFAALAWHGMILNEVLPLWAITHTDVPKPVLGGLFALNTVMAVLLQVRATRTADTVAGSTRLLRLAALCTAAACPMLALSGLTRGWVTIAVLATSVALLTATELWSSAAEWLFATEVPPPDQRGAYEGAFSTVGGIGQMIGPVALTYLGISTGGWGWWVIAGLFLVCAAVTRPVTAWVTRTPRNGQVEPERTAATLS
ncbi:MFS transporter [Longispora sp. NPDC051575]|uniref:MFS transporter n=1 Tax=Longispora sp. NPDC051575 TaxID=3154943 RepID=UPI00343D60F4